MLCFPTFVGKATRKEFELSVIHDVAALVLHIFSQTIPIFVYFHSVCFVNTGPYLVTICENR